jgi:hypothetical protein
MNEPYRKCASCGAVAHPASGCQYTPKTIVCSRCTREFWRWVKGQTNRRFRVGRTGKHVSFYEAVGKYKEGDKEKLLGEHSDE